MPTACLASCNSRGQGRCFLGQEEDMCCSFYLQNSCTNLMGCPSGLMADSNFVCGEFLTLRAYRFLEKSLFCTHTHLHTYTNTHAHTVCPSLSLDNGYVSYSQADRGIGSVATYNCNPGYQLTSSQAGMIRTCSESGWSSQTFTCECEYIPA